MRAPSQRMIHGGTRPVFGRRQVNGMPGIVQHAGRADDEIGQVLVIGAAFDLHPAPASRSGIRHPETAWPRLRSGDGGPGYAHPSRLAIPPWERSGGLRRRRRAGLRSPIRCGCVRMGRIAGHKAPMVQAGIGHARRQPGRCVLGAKARQIAGGHDRDGGGLRRRRDRRKTGPRPCQSLPGCGRLSAWPRPYRGDHDSSVSRP